VAADQFLGVLSRASRRKDRANWAGPALAGIVAALMIAANVRFYIAPSTRRDLFGFYPETRVVGEYIRGILDRYEVFLADSFPTDTLVFLTYRGGDFTLPFEQLWEDGHLILTRPLAPPPGKGVAFIANPSPENQPLFSELLARYPGARRFDLRGRPALGERDDSVATVVLIEPGSLMREVPQGPPELGPATSLADAAPGGSGSGPGKFKEIMGLAVTPDGAFYATDLGNNRFQKFDSDGTFLWAVGKPGSAPGEFKEPRGVAVDEKGDVYVVDSWNSRVQRFDSSGHFRLALTTERGMSGPKAIALDGRRVLVTDTGNAAVEVFDVDGAHLATWGKEGTGEGEFREPTGIACDQRGNFYVADTGNGRILAAWGVDEWKNNEMVETFMVWDPRGRLLFTDPPRGRVIAFNSKGERTGSWSRYMSPTGLALKANGSLMISERYDNRLLVAPWPAP
jgi:sugar lactone lactonase YvrE